MINIKTGTLHLPIKIYQFNIKDYDPDFLKNQFGITSSSWQFTTDENGHLGKTRPVVETLNHGHVFLEDNDYLLYLDHDQDNPEYTPLIADLYDYPILVPANDFDTDMMPLSEMLENHYLSINKEK